MVCTRLVPSKISIIRPFGRLSTLNVCPFETEPTLVPFTLILAAIGKTVSSAGTIVFLSGMVENPRL